MPASSASRLEDPPRGAACRVAPPPLIPLSLSPLASLLCLAHPFLCCLQAAGDLQRRGVSLCLVPSIITSRDAGSCGMTLTHARGVLLLQLPPANSLCADDVTPSVWRHQDRHLHRALLPRQTHSVTLLVAALVAPARLFSLARNALWLRLKGCHGKCYYCLFFFCFCFLHTNYHSSPSFSSSCLTFSFLRRRRVAVARRPVCLAALPCCSTHSFPS